MSKTRKLCRWYKRIYKILLKRLWVSVILCSGDGKTCSNKQVSGIFFGALINALINSFVSVLLIAGLVAVKRRNYILHKRIMLGAIILSVLFLVSYICHHLFAGETRFGDLNHDGLVSDMEKSAAGSLRVFYYIILGTHIPLAGIILPFILFTAYRGLTAEFPRHKKMARITWPVWLYVSVTGVLVYILISPYY